MLQVLVYIFSLGVEVEDEGTLHLGTHKDKIDVLGQKDTTGTQRSTLSVPVLWVIVKNLPDSYLSVIQVIPPQNQNIPSEIQLLDYWM